MYAQTFTKFSAMVAQGFAKSWSYKVIFLGNLFANLISVLSFFFMHRLFAELGVEVVAGGDYFTFVLIGGTFTRYLAHSMLSFSMMLNEELPKGTIEPALVTATSPVFSILGPAMWVFIEGTVILILKLLLGYALGANFGQINWLSAVIFAVLGLLCVMCFGILSAAVTIVFKRSDPITSTLKTIANVFSGVYFPVETFPPFLQIVSYLLPFTFAIRGLRGAIIEGLTVSQLSNDFFALLIFSVILLPISIVCLGYAIRYTKQTGNLGHY